jgi:subtilisin-like proprotein convertase family protein
MDKFHFKSTTTVTIDAGAPSSVQSILTISGITQPVKDIRVKLNLNHSYASDLVIRLQSPSGNSIVLVSNAGGSGDNFFETEFSDNAVEPINQQSPPFTGVFTPNEPLSTLLTDDPNGDWILEIQDQAFQDGGTLTEWELSFETEGTAQLPLIYNNMTSLPISSGAPNVVSSEIVINDQDGIRLTELALTLDISHSYTNDLDIKLEAPDGETITLVAFAGGSGDNFQQTKFSDSATADIQDSSPPFSGSFKPQESLATFTGKAINGTWRLTISDTANQDGGSLNFWKLCMLGDNASPAPVSPFAIDVRFVGGLSPSQQAIFTEAANRWSEAIVGDLPTFTVDGEQIDDLLILAEGIDIDGPNNILGQAGPTHVRPGSMIPVKGIMSFDSADLDQMEQSGELLDVIIHEMGHVLGIGTLWAPLRLIASSGTNDPLFIGPAAMREYGRLLGTTDPIAVPVANTGGGGTREGHWREITFDSELMTGFDDPGKNAMSRLTIASLQDLGYQVNLDAADPYSLPLRQLGIESVDSKTLHQCHRIQVPEIIVLSHENEVS